MKLNLTKENTDIYTTEWINTKAMIYTNYYDLIELKLKTKKVVFENEIRWSTCTFTGYTFHSKYRLFCMPEPLSSLVIKEYFKGRYMNLWRITCFSVLIVRSPASRDTRHHIHAEWTKNTKCKCNRIQIPYFLVQDQVNCLEVLFVDGERPYL